MAAKDFDAVIDYAGSLEKEKASLASRLAESERKIAEQREKIDTLTAASRESTDRLAAAETAPQEAGADKDQTAKLTAEVQRLEQEGAARNRELEVLRKGRPAEPATAQPATAEPAAPGDEEYRIGPGDVLDISVWKAPELSRNVTVRPEGTVSLPLLNEVRAGGLTPLALREALIKGFSEFVPSPEVSVIVSQVHSYAVSVIGQVNQPGRYELKSRTTILEALAMAGDLTQFASRRGIYVLRNDGKTTQQIDFNYNRATAGRDENFYLRSGDIVVVP